METLAPRVMAMLPTLLCLAVALQGPLPAPTSPPGAPQDTATVLTDDPAAQELLGIQSSLAFASVAGLSVSFVAALAGVWLTLNGSPSTYPDGHLKNPPLRLFFEAQASSALVILVVMASLALPMGPMLWSICALGGAALSSALSTLDARGRTTRRVVGRVGASVVLGLAALVPVAYLVGALACLPPMLAAFAFKQFYPLPQVSSATQMGLPYATMATVVLLTGAVVALPVALVAAAVAALGAVLLQ